MTDNDRAAVEALALAFDGAPSTPTRAIAHAILDAIRAGKVPWVRIAGDEECLPLERERNAKLRAEVERLRGEIIPVGWEVLEQSGCPRCGDDVVAEPAMDGDGFIDGNPARCQSCGLPGQVTVDDDGAHFSADDRQWEIDAEAKRADKATAERDRLAGLLGDIKHYLENQSAYRTQRLFDLRDRIDAVLAEIGGGK